MAAITPEEALAYFRRWELVREAEARELRRTPMATKLQQLAALMASRHIFGPELDREAETHVVRERWARLRRFLHHSKARVAGGDTSRKRVVKFEFLRHDAHDIEAAPRHRLARRSGQASDELERRTTGLKLPRDTFGRNGGASDSHEP